MKHKIFETQRNKQYSVSGRIGTCLCSEQYKFAKVKSSLYDMPVQTQRGGRVTGPRNSQNSVLQGNAWSAPRSGRCIPRKDLAPSVHKAGWPSGSVWIDTKMLFQNRDSIPSPSSPNRIAILTAKNFLLL
jgi:hypothetical protein